ncbi:MAG: hypothetical protein IJE66_04465 [Akkermansia sp.]|nr:hypothetical protein [Akkermansia sp.]MBQ2814243.1 hypothetical protein [Akkermansia sp.]
MNRFAAIAAILSPTLCAATPTDTPWLADGVKAARAIVNLWEEQSHHVGEELKFFHASLPADTGDTTLPESPNGDTVIICDRALLFDAESSRLVYVGNVRMRDARLTMRAKDNLYVRLQDSTLDKGKESSAQQLKPVPDASKKPTAAPAAKPAAAPRQPVKEKEVKEPEQPGHIDTGSAVVDTQNNHIILYSPPGAAPIEITRGSDIVRVCPSADSPARILADPDGNVLLEGQDIYLCGKDKDGAISELRIPRSTVYYHAANQSLTVPGKCYLTHPNGTLACSEKLCIYLQAEPQETQQADKKEFLSQFTGVRLSGIRSAVAVGDVQASTDGVNGSAPGTAHGDRLTYDGSTGACSIEGGACRLTYGEHNSLYADRGIHLLPNGDIELLGSRIYGTYERPAQQEGAAPVRGTFETAGDVIFRAESGIVSTTGLRTQDSESSFSCTGTVRLHLARKEGAVAPEQKPGMPNLAVTTYGGDVQLVEAEGDIRAGRLEGQTLVNEMRGNQLTMNLRTGEATLLGTPDIPAIISHENSRIEAYPGEEIEAKLDVLANGDLRLTGGTIRADMKTRDGMTTARCREFMYLYRADHRVETGSSVELTSPTAILTTNGPLHAILQPDPKAEAPSGRYPQHHFNYIGVRTADTAQGGSVRTAKGSMQCSGPIHLDMDPTAATTGEYAGLRRATAAGNVKLLTKSSDKRLLHATGDLLTVNAITGMKTLTGRKVTLGDANNTHIVSGKGAAVHVDAKNNARISGEKHTTIATKLNEQAEKQKQDREQQKQEQAQQNQLKQQNN